jgi:hypothetical protein
MHITLVTAAYIAAALVAGTTPAAAQTLPFYDVDAETARCVTEAATGKEWTEAIRNWCQAHWQRSTRGPQRTGGAMGFL